MEIHESGSNYTPQVAQPEKSGFTARISESISKTLSRIQTAYEHSEKQMHSEPTNKEMYLAAKSQFKKLTGLDGKTKKEAVDTDKVAKKNLPPPESKKPSFFSNVSSNISSALKSKSTPREAPINSTSNVSKPKVSSDSQLSKSEVSEQHIKIIAKLAQSGNYDKAVEYIENNKNEINLNHLDGKLSERKVLTPSQILIMNDKLKEKNLIVENSLLSEKAQEIKDTDIGFKEIMDSLNDKNYPQVSQKLAELALNKNQDRLVENILSKDKPIVNKIMQELFRAEIQKNIKTVDGKKELKGELFRENNLVPALYSALIGKSLASKGLLTEFKALGKKYQDDPELTARLKEYQKGQLDNMSMGDKEIYKNKLTGIFNGINELINKVPADGKGIANLLKNELEKAGIDSDQATKVAVRDFFLRGAVPELFNAAIEAKVDPFIAQSVQTIVNGRSLSIKNPSLAFMDDTSEGSSLAQNYLNELISNFSNILKS